MKLDDVKHLLPEMAQLIATLIGLPKAARLIDVWGGTTFPVSKNKRREGQIRYEALAEVVGVEAADKLTAHFGGEVLAIPRCAVAMREVRDRLIRAEFDELTREHPAVHAVNQLARKYQMTERNVWMVLKKVDQISETPQGKLF
ncbi:Mor transcription activator family protein [Chromobacterium sp. Beijing]|uniref:Mor transcription activator family protein n=1 Tax=Chromobacterium sp. Beijing TaxID=2735795 RepID=UPI001F158D26|nr:Mor transcription activator family protein [Chromobacterium sp. Beijing]UJB30284.1 DNA transposition protein [Chromobacterium sp. Beijing]